MAPKLVAGRIYGWDELGRVFGFKPAYLSAAGGMISRPQLDALMLITYPGGAKSFDYEDYWDGEALIYTGRGKVGDQELVGPNRDLAENVRTNFVFEGGVGSRALRFLGTAQSRRYWKARGVGDNGVERDIVRYRLEFTDGGRTSSAGNGRSQISRDVHREPMHRRRRKFDPMREPGTYAAPVQRATEEEVAALREKANKEHHALLVRLEAELQARGWTGLNEIPGAVDLEAERKAKRVLFEAKVLTSSNELRQTRAAFAQLLEYRHFYGERDDRLCAALTGPIADRRLRFLEAHGIAVAYDDGNGLVCCGTLAPRLLDA